jgi:hypothetical protein
LDLRVLARKAVDFAGFQHCRAQLSRRPVLLVTDPPYGIELDSEWRDRAGLTRISHRTMAKSRLSWHN